ncbi:hypothetical protein N2152v2_004455 [Parachlorella kessleri]
MSSSTSATTVSQQQASCHRDKRRYAEQPPQERQQQPEQQHSVWEPGSDEAESAPTRAASPDSRTTPLVTTLGTVRQQFASALERNFATVVQGLAEVDCDDDDMPDTPVSSGKKGGGTRYRGVTKHKRTQRYEAHIWQQKKQIYLGGFDAEVLAAKSHDIMALRCKGPGTDLLNFPLSDYSHITPFMGRLSTEDVVTALRNYSKAQSGKKIPPKGGVTKVSAPRTPAKRQLSLLETAATAAAAAIPAAARGSPDRGHTCAAAALAAAIAPMPAVGPAPIAGASRRLFVRTERVLSRAPSDALSGGAYSSGPGPAVQDPTFPGTVRLTRQASTSPRYPQRDRCPPAPFTPLSTVNQPRAGASRALRNPKPSTAAAPAVPAAARFAAAPTYRGRMLCPGQEQGLGWGSALGGAPARYPAVPAGLQQHYGYQLPAEALLRSTQEHTFGLGHIAEQHHSRQLAASGHASAPIGTPLGQAGPMWLQQSDGGKVRMVPAAPAVYSVPAGPATHAAPPVDGLDDFDLDSVLGMLVDDQNLTFSANDESRLFEWLPVDSGHSGLEHTMTGTVLLRSPQEQQEHLRAAAVMSQDTSLCSAASAYNSVLPLSDPFWPLPLLPGELPHPLPGPSYGAAGGQHAALPGAHVGAAGAGGSCLPSAGLFM